MKLAFLFLTRGDHQQPELWMEFFEHHSREYSMYVHAKIPSHVTQPLWRKAMISEHVETVWADISIVRATIALLKAAFKDPMNEHFILVSESCVPIKSFVGIKAELSHDGRGRMAWSHASDTLPKARAKRMAKAVNISPSHWLYHPQWVTFSRAMVSILLENDRTKDFEQVRVPDECYFGSVLASLRFDFESGILPIASTYTDWEKPRPVRSAPNVYNDLDKSDIHTFRNSRCFFARKFSRASPIRKFGLHLKKPTSQFVEESV